jgi:hypothetical protein
MAARKAAVGRRKACWLLLMLLAALCGEAIATCTPPAGATGAPYAAIAGAHERDVQLLLDEYTYRQRWTTHAQAIAGGFRQGDRVYGEVLEGSEKTFNQERVSKWRRAYERSGRTRFRSGLGTKVDIGLVDTRLVTWLVEVCLDPGIWSRVTALDDCRFSFTAGVKRADPAAPVNPTSLQTSGATCRPWVAGALSVQGASVQCTRSGDGEVTITLETSAGRTIKQMLSALAIAASVPEPIRETRLAEPDAEVVRLTRFAHYQLVRMGAGCPKCKLYAADLSPSTPDAAVLEVTTVSSSGAGWLRCPAGFRCGVYEFSPTAEPDLLGCRGVRSCRVWRLAETDAEGMDVIQLIVQRSESVCVNCPAGMDYESALAAWEASKAKSVRCAIAKRN